MPDAETHSLTDRQRAWFASLREGLERASMSDREIEDWLRLL